MGFIEQLEREKQCKLLVELTKQVLQNASGVQLKGNNIPAIDKEALDRANARDFLKENAILLVLLQNLNQLGYPEYFTGVARITDSLLASRLYVRKGDYCDRAEIVLHGGNSTIPINRSEVYLSDTIALKIKNAHERIRQELLQSNLAEYKSLPPSHFMADPTGQFFNDNRGDSNDYDTEYINRIVSMRDKKYLSDLPARKQLSLRLPTEQVVNWFAEPQEVGIGFRFLKHLRKEEETKEYKDKKSGSYMMSEAYSTYTRRESWHNAVYVRIMPSGRAIITGSTQQEIEIPDLCIFDKTLEEVMKYPAIIYSRRDQLKFHPSMPVHHGFG